VFPSVLILFDFVRTQLAPTDAGGVAPVEPLAYTYPVMMDYKTLENFLQTDKDDVTLRLIFKMCDPGKLLFVDARYVPAPTRIRTVFDDDGAVPVAFGLSVLLHLSLLLLLFQVYSHFAV
jgi:hypothetical protein